MDLDKLRTLCMSFPGTTEGIKWEEHICFMVAEKLFVITGEDRISFKASPDEVEELIEKDGIVPNSHLARSNWVTVQGYNKLKPKEWQHYIRQSYDLIRSKLPKKIQAGLQ